MSTPCSQSLRSSRLVQGVSQKTLHSWENQTLGTSYSETTISGILRETNISHQKSKKCLKVRQGYTLPPGPTFVSYI